MNMRKTLSYFLKSTRFPIKMADGTQIFNFSSLFETQLNCKVFFFFLQGVVVLLLFLSVNYNKGERRSQQQHFENWRAKAKC